jgi:putative transposase
MERRGARGRYDEKRERDGASVGRAEVRPGTQSGDRDDEVLDVFRLHVRDRDPVPDPRAAEAFPLDQAPREVTRVRDDAGRRQPFRDRAEVYRPQAKAGTSHFHAYASAYVVRRGERFTVALLPVPRGGSLAEVVKALLRQSRSVGVKASLVLLDRGFYAVDVIRYLHRARLPFVMPVKLTGRKPGHPKGVSGTRVFTLATRSRWFEHTVTSGARTARVAICVACRNYRGQWKRHGRQRLI